MKAVILAGGLGTRLKPLTEKTPKVMVPVKGKPFIAHLLNLLIEGGVNEAVLCLGYLAEQVMDFVSDGRKWGIKVSYSIEKEPLGTAGALKQAEPMLNDTFLVINGDTYLPIKHIDVMETFLRLDKEGTMTVCSHPKYRNDVLVKDGLVVKNSKLNPEPDFNYVNAGVLALKRDALLYYRHFLPSQTVSLEEGLYPPLVHYRLMAAYITKERFYDIGTFEGIRALEEYFDSNPDAL